MRSRECLVFFDMTRGGDGSAECNRRIAPDYNPGQVAHSSPARADPTSLIRYAGDKSRGRAKEMTAPASVSMLLLRNVPLFSVLPENQLALLTSALSRKSFPRGTMIIAAGDVTESLFVVISGRLKVMMTDDEGREVILAILGPNEFFGEMGLIDDHPRSASVVALEACELLSLSKRDFKRCLSENFEMTMTVMRGLAKRLREADQKIGSLALMDVYGRVAHLLLDMAETVDGQKVVTKKLAKQDIAKMIGASREMVSRVMKDLQSGGYIEVRPGSIFLHETILTID